jgi:hypothetical protein
MPLLDLCDWTTDLDQSSSRVMHYSKPKLNNPSKSGTKRTGVTCR